MTIIEPTAQGTLRFQRHFTTGEDPYQTVEWSRRDARAGSGEQAFFLKNVEAPAHWSDQSVAIVAKLYFATVDGVREHSVRQIIWRVVNKIATEGDRYGYFATAEDEATFRDELTWLLLHQHVTFNTPVWLNLGVPGREQCASACFLLSVEDKMLGPDSITDWYQKEARIFKSGAGSGINVSTLRGSMEKLSTGGAASGPVSYVRPSDANAGTLKSGGAHRRAAKLVRLDADHPDIRDFVQCKVREDERMSILSAAGVNLDPTSPEGERNIAECTSFQNQNISVGVTDEFMRQATETPDVAGWALRARVTGETLETINAADLLRDVAEAAWKCADPGMQYHDTINAWHTTPSLGPITTTNPCFSGETLVAVADGRGAVRFDELAREGQDVAVYTRALDGKLAIRTMRNPRITGREDTYLVKFRDGTSIRATENHPFVGIDGEVVRTRELRSGSRLAALSRYKATFEEVFRGSDSRSQEYWWLSNGRCSNKGEHRLIAGFARGRELDSNEVAHHRDFSATNNHPDNLIAMTKTDHDELHAARMRGASNPANRCMNDVWRSNLSRATSGLLNPNANAHSNDEVFAAAVSLALEVGGIPTHAEWKTYARSNGLPESFQGWRESHLGTLSSVLQRAAAIAYEGPKVPDGTDPKTARMLYDWLQAGYDAFLRNGRVVARKRCEGCGVEMIVESRERGCCSHGCAWTAHRERYVQGIRKGVLVRRRTFEERRDDLRAKQLEIYRSLDDGALRKDWVAACKRAGVSAEIARPHSPFRFWRDLKEEANVYNHVVESVTRYGEETVYNGTVDEFHNLYVGSDAFDPAVTTKSGREKMTFVCARQCGETVLNDDSSCNLGTLNVGSFVRDGKFCVDDFRAATDLMITAMDITCSFSDLPTERITRNTRELRQLGLGYTNLGATLMRLGLPYDSDEGRDFAAALSALMTGRAYRRSQELAAALGPFKRFAENSETMLNVIGKHCEAVATASVRRGEVWDAASEEWDLVNVHVSDGFRNSQVTLVQPGGTTSFMVGADTTGIEPAFSLLTYKGLAGGGTMRTRNGAVEDALAGLGYDGKASEAILALEQHGDAEFLRIIRPEHRRVFETAAGSGAIGPMAHVKMVAAVQPFLSQAISKTVNLPHSATVEDVLEVYVQAWKLGCKAVSLYRDGSKSTQVLRTSSKEDSEKEAETATSPARDPKPTRHRMPRVRQSVTTKFVIDGHEGYVTAGTYPDGNVGEIFLSGIGKDGSTLGGMSNAWAVAVSIALQHGVPLETLVRKYVNVSFPPTGATNDPDVPFAASIPDYVARSLAAQFLAADVCEELGILTPEVKLRKTAALDGDVVLLSVERPDAEQPDMGEACRCGTMMQRSGTCWSCPGCGATTGCG